MVTWILPLFCWKVVLASVIWGTDSFKKSRLGPCDVYVHRNIKWGHIRTGSPLVWVHSTYNQVMLSGPVSHMRLGLLVQWYIGMLA